MRITLGSFLFWAGCQNVNWQKPTTYTINDLQDFQLSERGRKQDTRQQLKEALDKYRLIEVTEGVPPSKFVFTLDGLQTAPVESAKADLTFGSVSGAGRAEIALEGLATPEATVKLDTGESQLIETVADKNGTWHVDVRRTSKLRERGGWIYGLFEKKDSAGQYSARQYMKMNVMDTTSSTKISVKDLPKDSVRPKNK